MIACISTYTRPLAELDALRPEHLAFLDGLGDLVVMSGRREPPVGGVIVLRGSDPAEAERVLSADPFVRAGAADYVCTAFASTRGVTD